MQVEQQAVSVFVDPAEVPDLQIPAVKLRPALTEVDEGATDFLMSGK